MKSSVLSWKLSAAMSTFGSLFQASFYINPFFTTVNLRSLIQLSFQTILTIGFPRKHMEKPVYKPSRLQVICLEKPLVSCTSSNKCCVTQLGRVTTCIVGNGQGGRAASGSRSKPSKTDSLTHS